MSEEIERRKRQGVKVRVMRDYWDDQGERIRTGTELEIPLDRASIENAMDAIETGMIKRVK